MPGRSNLRFAARAAGAILAPLALVTWFFASAPSALGQHGGAVLTFCIATGLLATWPIRLTAMALLSRALYVIAMLYASIAWALFVLPSCFPENTNRALADWFR